MGQPTLLVTTVLGVKAVVTKKVIRQVALELPGAVIDTHSNCVPALHHGERIGKFPRWLFAAGIGIAGTAGCRVAAETDAGIG